MKVTTVILTLMTAAAVSASGLAGRDVCGSGYGKDQRRTNSPCQASNGDRRFCGCDRTGVVECKYGKWTEVKDCGKNSCRGGNDGGAKC